MTAGNGGGNSGGGGATAASTGTTLGAYVGPTVFPRDFSIPRSRMPFAEQREWSRPQMSTDPLTYDKLLREALSGDTLSCLCNLVGLHRFHVIGAVCTAWHDATRAKMREWGVLTYVRAIGKGFGKLPGYFDMPTWLCMLPDGMWGSNLCVVDSCNYRLQLLAPDGTLLRTVGRPGARFGELSSPSSVAYDPKAGGRPVVYSSSNVGPEDRRVLMFDLESWRVLESTPEGTGKTELDAPEGMAVSHGRAFVVDTAHHRIVAFDAATLEKVGQYPPVAWHASCGQGRQWDQLDNPHGIAAYEGELFVSDTHNDRIQVFTVALEWIGTVGQRGTAAGQFTYPRGVTVARSGSKAPPLLYVCEQTRIQALTLLGEPRIVIAVPGAISLCGICSDGVRVYCTDMDAHKVHVLRLTHGENWREKRREAIDEARARNELRAGGGSGGGGGGGGGAKPTDAERTAERNEKERRRDLAVKHILSGRTIHAMLRLPASATEHELRQGVRLAMRLLHPDLLINQRLKGTKDYARIEAAFKKANNLQDMRIEKWFHGEPL